MLSIKLGKSVLIAQTRRSNQFGLIHACRPNNKRLKVKTKGAPGLAFETWDPCNLSLPRPGLPWGGAVSQFQLETHPNLCHPACPACPGLPWSLPRSLPWS